MAGRLTGADGTLGPGPQLDVVTLDGTGVRAGDKRLGTAAHVAVGLTGRSEINARTDIGARPLEHPGLRDLLTVQTARALHCVSSRCRVPL